MLVYHAINPIAFEIGPVKVHWYGIMYLIGFAAGWWLARLRAVRPGSTWKASDVDDFVFYAMLGVILGGRIGYVLFYGLSYWENDPWYPLKIWEGGMSFHGGLLGVLAAIAIFAVRQGRNVADVFDFGAPLPGIGLMAGRIGNFINGELWGKITDVPWAVIFPRSMPDGTPDGLIPPRHPSQLYEAALEGLLLLALMQARFWGSRVVRERPGRLAGEFLIAYACVRVAGEAFREPDASLILGMSRGTFYSLFLVAFGLYLAFRRSRPLPQPVPPK